MCGQILKKNLPLAIYIVSSYTSSGRVVRKFTHEDGAIFMAGRVVRKFFFS